MSDPLKPKVVELQSQYGKFEIVLNNPHSKRLTIFMLGDRHRGFIPPPQMFQDFRKLLDAALESPEDRVVLSHPYLSVLQVDLPEGPVVVTSPAPKAEPEASDLKLEVVNPVPDETYQVGYDDGCIVVGVGDKKGAAKVWLSYSMIDWLARQPRPAARKQQAQPEFLPYGSNGKSKPAS